MTKQRHQFRCEAKAVGDAFQLTLSGFIDRDNTNAGANVVAALEGMPEGAALDVRLRDFYGGDVNEGLTIYHALKELAPAMHVDGVVASMGTVIMCAGGHVTATKRSKVMMHRPVGGTWGTADELETVTANLRGLEQEITEILADRTGMEPEAAAAEFMPPGRDRWYTAAQLKEVGLVDEVLGGNGRTVAMADARKLKMPEEILDRFAAVLGSGPDEPDHNNQDRMNEELVAKLGLAKGADDASVLKAVDELVAKAEAATKELGAMKAEETKAAEAEAIGLIEAALKSDRIAKPQAEAMKAEVAKAPKLALGLVRQTLAAMPAHTPLGGRLNTGGATAKQGLAELVQARADWSYMRWAKEDSRNLARIQAEMPDAFAQIREQLS